MDQVIRAIKKFLRDLFNLHEDKADEDEIVESITRGSEFKGTNLWALIFAIFIASIGLNVNSTAVIIGAMLISPLMGPLMGIGLGIGITNLDLLKKGLKNLSVAAIISVATSALYFLLTPISEAKSELLARTTPSLWDVLIAFFGGLAGIVASTRKYRSTVIPGVAIATALMPPLCTAGYGLATGHYGYFISAIYLFFINSVFICTATLLVVRSLRFQKRRLTDSGMQRRVTRVIFFIVVVTVIPSTYFAIKIVDKSIFERNAKQFVQNEFNFKQSQVVNRVFKYDPPQNIIELLLLGKDLSEGEIDTLKLRMKNYKLFKTSLSIRQGLNSKQEIDLSQIKASILEDVFKKQKEQDTLSTVELSKLERPIPDIKAELKALYPSIETFSLTNAVVTNVDSSRNDTLTIFLGKFNRFLSRTERDKLNDWIRVRVKADSLKFIVE